jgi:hypothetical protein
MPSFELLLVFPFNLMKKTLLTIVSLAWMTSFGSLFFPQVYASSNGCVPSYDDLAGSKTVKELLAECKPTRGIQAEGEDYTIERGAQQKVIAIANQLISAGSILAIGAIVYAAILYTIAAGDDERIKKAKGSLKFGIIGFVMMLISFPLVNAIIKLIYSTSAGS